MYRFQLEFLCEGPLFFWHDALPLDALFQVYTLRESPSSPDWGKIEATHSWVLLIFAYSQNAHLCVFFQVSPPLHFTTKSLFGNQIRLVKLLKADECAGQM